MSTRPSAELEPLIEAHGISKSYRTAKNQTVCALADVSFTIRSGEFVSIVGPSGCGKSTLLKILAGLIAPTTGTLSIRGHTIAGPNPDVGVVFQQPALLPWRTVIQNVLFPVEIRRLNIERHRNAALSLLNTAGLKGFESHYPHELSIGMQQRVSIVRALLQEPKVLLMDEPFAALDAITREQMNLETLNVWKARESTVVFVTHSIAESVFLSDRVLVIASRPGSITSIIEIDLPRPRPLSIIDTNSFGFYTGLVRGALKAGKDSGRWM